jgi:hypothetical protein
VENIECRVIEDKEFNVSAISQEIEKRFRSSLEDEAKRIGEEFPSVRATVSSFATKYRHVLGLQCIFLEASKHQPDLVALCITTENINVAPAVHADISWGAPSGYVESELFESPIELSDSVLEVIDANLPRLYETLISVVKKGSPGA